MNGTHIMERVERHLFYWVCTVATLAGIILIFVSVHIEPFSSEISSIGTTLMSVGIIGLIFQYYFQTASEKRLEEFKIVGQDSYKNIEKLLEREVIGGKVITSGEDYYIRATELAKNAKKIRIANFYPNPGGATGVKDADKFWLKKLEEIIRNKKEPIEELTRIVSVNNPKRWEWVKSEMINKFEGHPNFYLYYNSKPDELPIPTMVIIDEKQKSGDREEKKNVIIVNSEKSTGKFESCLWFTVPKSCSFFMEYYEKLKSSQTTKPLVIRGEKKLELFDELEKEYGKNE